MKTGRGIASPFVEVEFVGCEYDSNNKYKTSPACTCSFNSSLLRKNARYFCEKSCF